MTGCKLRGGMSFNPARRARSDKVQGERALQASIWQPWSSVDVICLRCSILIASLGSIRAWLSACPSPRARWRRGGMDLSSLKRQSGLWQTSLNSLGKHVFVPSEPERVGAAQELMDGRGGNCSKRRSNASDYLVAGLLTCAHCGSRFIGTAARGNRYEYRHYTCHRLNRYWPKGCLSERLPAD